MFSRPHLLVEAHPAILQEQHKAQQQQVLLPWLVSLVNRLHAGQMASLKRLVSNAACTAFTGIDMSRHHPAMIHNMLPAIRMATL